MFQYRIGENGSLVPAAEKGPAFVTVLSAEDVRQDESFPHRKQMLHNLGSIRYSRAEIFSDSVQGVLRFPDKGGQQKSHLAIGFCLERERLVLIESLGPLRDLPERLNGRLPPDAGPDRVLLLLAERESEEDIFFLQHIEERLEALEEQVLTGKGDSPFETLLGIRKKLSELNAHYEQLSALAEALGDGGADPVRDPAPWRRFAGMMWRLKQYASLLREYAIQLREVCQAQQDARQNRTMSILTVVTTIFLPLTLLTGWYGMNFANMPELHWRYGYPAAIAAAVIIAVAEIVYFKKKKML